MAAARIRIDERTPAEARRLLREWDWDAEQSAAVFLPPPIARRALLAVGYRPAPHGAWIGPDGEQSIGDLDEAVRAEYTAAALAGAETSGGDPIEEALRQIREVAMIPVGQVLLSPEERIRALTAKLERIGNIAADGEPDEDWRLSLIDEAGS
jgi:hypothetical protein